VTTTSRPRPPVVATARPGAPRWLWIATAALTVAGLGVSIYLTAEHYTASTTLACPDTGVVNCVKVTTSPQSMVLGIPVAVLGLVFFVAMTALTVPAAWRNRSAPVRWSRLGLAAIGVVSVIYLLYVELFVVDAICLWCTTVHVITLALFVIIAYREVVEPA
jgi:uncharacterized membrane protein